MLFTSGRCGCRFHGCKVQNTSLTRHEHVSMLRALVSALWAVAGINKENIRRPWRW
ncbi:hypothetical protein CY34DRAFT_803789 [Suillus luteus UH-Slu-Lm8-n1]|uniref:Uncharacterized protein n=1 Tax=Suillus luteus UH-Slu-Lm8-n1 TaxID=930992 RepID=A0A0D0ANQ3_9AGAM|nr:hypothetical protein CY34DRAFT_803789 [Suillus luteus UH-Slu-Lm8-n1]